MCVPMVCPWGSQDNVCGVASLLHLSHGSRDWTQILRVKQQALYPLSHLADPQWRLLICFFVFFFFGQFSIWSCFLCVYIYLFLKYYPSLYSNLRNWILSSPFWGDRSRRVFETGLGYRAITGLNPACATEVLSWKTKTNQTKMKTNKNPTPWSTESTLGFSKLSLWNSWQLIRGSF